jgi:hypothetical protein
MLPTNMPAAEGGYRRRVDGGEDGEGDRRHGRRGVEEQKQ